MPASLLEILRSIPDHRRAEGKRFDLATVVLYSMGMVAVATRPANRMILFAFICNA